MAVSLAQVVALADLELRVVTTTPTLDRPLRWVAPSELADPTPWIEPGDLVLTTGMAMSADDAEARAYVRRLRAVDAAGLGFGIGVHHSAIPEALVDEADRVGLPVVEVPEPLPFVAISRAVSRLQAAEEYAESGAAFDSQRRMIRNVLATLRADGSGSDSPSAAVVSTLARHLEGFALHLGSSGELLEASPPDAGDRAVEFVSEVDRLRPRGLLASASLSSAVEHVVIIPVGVREKVRGFLVAGGRRPPTSADQAVLNLSVSLLSWAGSQMPAADRRLDRWRALLIEHGRTVGVSAELLASLELRGLDPRRAVALFVVPTDGGAWEPAVEGHMSGDDLVLAADGEGRWRGFAAAEGAGSPGPAVRQLVASDHVSAVGVSAVTDLTQAANVRQALEQAEAAARCGPGVRLFDEMQARSLTTLVDRVATEAWGHAYLQSLTAAPEGRELQQTLRAWIGCHGQVDATAQQLGIHRHTVRHRLRRAEAVLGSSLDDPDVRANLWFALSTAGPERTTISPESEQ